MVALQFSLSIGRFKPSSPSKPHAVRSQEKPSLETVHNAEVNNSWNQLVNWSKKKQLQNGSTEIDKVSKIAVFGGGSFGTAMGVALARKKSSLKVEMLLRDPRLVEDINERHINSKYLPVENQE